MFLVMFNLWLFVCILIFARSTNANLRALDTIDTIGNYGVDPVYIVIGDMLIPFESNKNDDADRRQLDTVSDDKLLWFGTRVNNSYLVPYDFYTGDWSDATLSIRETFGANTMTVEEQQHVREVMDQMEIAVGHVIKFVPLEGNFDVAYSNTLDPSLYWNENRPHTGHLRIGKFLNGTCTSSVGLQIYSDPNIVNLGTNCYTSRTIEHELMHALGVFHEHTRPDRDTYVQVNYDNINEVYHQQFDIQNESLTRGITYDFHSIMHYGANAAALNSSLHSFGLTELSLNAGITLQMLGDADEMTKLDIERIRLMYRCSGDSRTRYNACSADCLCGLNDGYCSDDIYCESDLICSPLTHFCVNPPTPAPTKLPTTHSPTKAPSLITQPTYFPTAFPTLSTNRPTAEPTKSVLQTEETEQVHKSLIQLLIIMVSISIVLPIVIFCVYKLF